MSLIKVFKISMISLLVSFFIIFYLLPSLFGLFLKPFYYHSYLALNYDGTRLDIYNPRFPFAYMFFSHKTLNNKLYFVIPREYCPITKIYLGYNTILFDSHLTNKTIGCNYFVAVISNYHNQTLRLLSENSLNTGLNLQTGTPKYLRPSGYVKRVIPSELKLNI